MIPGSGGRLEIEVRPLLPGDSIDELTSLLHRAYRVLFDLGLRGPRAMVGDELPQRDHEQAPGVTFVGHVRGRARSMARDCGLTGARRAVKLDPP